MSASDFTFNGLNRLIVISTGVTAVNVQDMYSRWKDWTRTSDNLKYSQAFRAFGGDTTIPGQYAPRYYFLTNGWKVVVDNDQDVSFGTNLYTDDLSSAYIVGSGSSVSDRNSDAVIVKNEIAESLDYAGEIHLNSNVGVSGTTYPIGTTAFPVNNIHDAKIIANNRGIDFIRIHNTVIIDEDVHEYTFKGGRIVDTVVFQNVNVSGCTFRECILIGSLSGSIAAETCQLFDGITGVDGLFKECGIGGSVYFNPGAECSFLDSASMIPNDFSNPSSLHLNYDTKIAIRRYAGTLDVYDSLSGSELTIGFEVGKCRILSGCTDGTIILRGVAALLDQSSGTTINTEGLLIPYSVASQHSLNVNTEILKNK